MSGHSLGGVMAAQYVNETNNTDALILLGAYSTKQIDKPVLSVYGSQDKVLNMETYRQNLPLISENLTEAVIDGGNHAQIGNYGAQNGDGMAKISPKKQQSETAEEIINFINELN
jgi:pimeloyl-ACP methyl ester carboxylesterase